MIGLVKEVFQQTVQTQTVKPESQQKTGDNFETYLQDDKDKKATTPTQQTTPEQTTSGTEMQTKMQELQDELNRKITAISPNGTTTNSILPQLLQQDTRMGLLQEVSKEMSKESLGSNLQGNFVDAEKSWKEVEMIMQSKERLSPGELLALQARLYQVSHHIEVMSKVVDQMASGVKTVLNTNV